MLVLGVVFLVSRKLREQNGEDKHGRLREEPPPTKDTKEEIMQVLGVVVFWLLGVTLVAWAIRNAIRANRFARIIRN